MKIIFCLLLSIKCVAQTDTTGRPNNTTRFYWREMFGYDKSDTTIIKTKAEENPYYKIGDTLIWFHHVYGWKPNHQDSLMNHLIPKQYDERY